MTTIFIVAAFILGAVVGSFLNVVIWRLPRGESLVSPPSACPGCASRIAPWHNIPILGYLILGGKCANCKMSISIRYPAVEALTGILSLLLGYKFAEAPHLFAIYFIFMSGIVAMTFIDLDHKIIPDSISLGGIPLGFAASFFTPLGWQGSLLGILLGGGSLLLVSTLYLLITKKEGMGMGDVKLLAAIGAFLGWEAVLFTIFTSSVVGSVIGVATLKIMGEDRDYQIPFGPFLGFGALLYIYVGPALISWYLGLMT